MTALPEESARPWFERWPELLEWELGRFSDLGLPAEVDGASRDLGQLRIRSEVAFGEGRIEVFAIYPSEYPELPPLLVGPPGLLERHQNPFGGNFCLLPRPLDDWPAAGWGAADLIADRLQSLLDDSAAGPERVAANEAPMPEPFSSYFEYAGDTAVLFPSDALPDPRAEHGRLWVGRKAPNIFLVESSDGGWAATELIELFQPGERLEVAWKRLDAPPPAGPGAAEIIGWIRAEHPDLLSARPPPPPPRQRKRAPRQAETELCALVFSEEGSDVGGARDAWIFVLILRRGRERAALVHTEIVSAEERGRRLRELAGLPARRIAVLGLGTVGAPIALHLARAGIGTLELIDCERFEFGNTTRHPLGLDYVGLPKTVAVAAACRRANPLCRATGHAIRLGQTAWAEGESPLARLTAVAEGVDLIVEATGSHQIAQLVGRLCAETGMPMVSAWMSEGFYGGEVARIGTAKTRCWTCFATDQHEGRTLHAESGPPSNVIVQGCSHPTTSGAGFDAEELAALAARLVVQTLEPEGGYPDADWDHAVVNFRRGPDDEVHPRFAVEKLERRGGCERCTVAVGSTAVR